MSVLGFVSGETFSKAIATFEWNRWSRIIADWWDKQIVSWLLADSSSSHTTDFGTKTNGDVVLYLLVLEEKDHNNWHPRNYCLIKWLDACCWRQNMVCNVCVIVCLCLCLTVKCLFRKIKSILLGIKWITIKSCRRLVICLFNQPRRSIDSFFVSPFGFAQHSWNQENRYASLHAHWLWAQSS